MKSLSMNASIAGCLLSGALCAGAAEAAVTHSLNWSVDPATPNLFLAHADGTVELDAYPSFAPVTLTEGDRLVIHVAFSGATLQVFDSAPLNLGLEALTLQLLPFDPAISGAMSVLVELGGVSGAPFSGSTTYTLDSSFSGGIVWQMARNFTDSQFGFTDLTVTYDFPHLASPVTIDRALIGAYGGDVRLYAAPVPAPSVLSLLVAGGSGILGAGCCGVRASRRRRSRP